MDAELVVVYIQKRYGAGRGRVMTRSWAERRSGTSVIESDWSRGDLYMTWRGGAVYFFFFLFFLRGVGLSVVVSAYNVDIWIFLFFILFFAMRKRALKGAAFRNGHCDVAAWSLSDGSGRFRFASRRTAVGWLGRFSSATPRSEGASSLSSPGQPPHTDGGEGRTMRRTCAFPVTAARADDALLVGRVFGRARVEERELVVCVCHWLRTRFLIMAEPSE